MITDDVSSVREVAGGYRISGGSPFTGRMLLGFTGDPELPVY